MAIFPLVSPKARGLWCKTACLWLSKVAWVVWEREDLGRWAADPRWWKSWIVLRTFGHC